MNSLFIFHDHSYSRYLNSYVACQPHQFAVTSESIELLFKYLFLHIFLNYVRMSWAINGENGDYISWLQIIL